MKNFKIAIIALLAVIISSCGDDDGPGFQFNQENIAGTYRITSATSTIVETEDLDTGGSITTTTEGTGDTFDNVVFTFGDDGTFNFTGTFRLVQITSRPGTNDVTTNDFITFDSDDRGTYSVSEESDTLTLNYVDGDLEIFDVTRFTSSEVRYVSEESFVDGDVTVTAMSEIRLRRIND